MNSSEQRNLRNQLIGYPQPGDRRSELVRFADVHIGRNPADALAENVSLVAIVLHADSGCDDQVVEKKEAILEEKRPGISEAVLIVPQDPRKRIEAGTVNALVIGRLMNITDTRIKLPTNASELMLQSQVALNAKDIEAAVAVAGRITQKNRAARDGEVAHDAEVFPSRIQAIPVLPSPVTNSVIRKKSRH